jgi:hypothetical protein
MNKSHEKRVKNEAAGLPYRLPDGRVVAVTAGTSLPSIPYQLADGRVVVATRVRPARPAHTSDR